MSHERKGWTRGSGATWGSPEGMHRVVPLRRESTKDSFVNTIFLNVFVNAVKEMPLPAGMMTDRAVAEADLITLVPGLELRFSPSESCWWRTLRSTRSVVAPRVPGGSGSPRMVALLGRGSDASAGLNSLSVIRHER